MKVVALMLVAVASFALVANAAPKRKRHKASATSASTSVAATRAGRPSAVTTRAAGTTVSTRTAASAAIAPAAVETAAMPAIVAPLAATTANVLAPAVESADIAWGFVAALALGPVAFVGSLGGFLFYRRRREAPLRAQPPVAASASPQPPRGNFAARAFFECYRNHRDVLADAFDRLVAESAQEAGMQRELAHIYRVGRALGIDLTRDLTQEGAGTLLTYAQRHVRDAFSEPPRAAIERLIGRESGGLGLIEDADVEKLTTLPEEQLHRQIAVALPVKRAAVLVCLLPPSLGTQHVRGLPERRREKMVAAIRRGAASRLTRAEARALVAEVTGSAPDGWLGISAAPLPRRLERTVQVAPRASPAPHAASPTSAVLQGAAIQNGATHGQNAPHTRSPQNAATRDPSAPHTASGQNAATRDPSGPYTASPQTAATHDQNASQSASTRTLGQLQETMRAQSEPSTPPRRQAPAPEPAATPATDKDVVFEEPFLAAALAHRLKSVRATRE